MSSNPVTINMPLRLDSEMLHAVRIGELTSCEDKDEMNKRIGWLICAYDELVHFNNFRQKNNA